MIRLGWVAGEPSPMRTEHLRLLAQVDDIDTTVIYAATTVQRRSWTVDLTDAVVLGGPQLPTTRILHHDYPLTPQIWPLLSRERFDCLVVGGWSLMATQLAIVWARAHRVPYLLVSENHLREPRPAWVRAVKSLVLRQVVPQASGHLVTGSLAREHQLHYGAAAAGIVIWPNTVDVAAFAARAERARAERRDEVRASLGAGPDTVVVLTVGRLIPEKAFEQLIAAVDRARALAAHPLQLVVAGDGPLEQALRVRAAELGVPVTFAGHVEGDRLVELYAAADVFALVSRRETWGIVVNEAAAASLPLVLSDRVGASVDLLVDAENGLLVRAGDVEGQARALARLADDPELRAIFGARSRELVAGWGYERSVSELAELVRRVARQS
ncbi:MAG: glycosyltransferase family 4 protein [Gaiellaceae bacterium]